MYTAANIMLYYTNTNSKSYIDVPNLYLYTFYCKGTYSYIKGKKKILWGGILAGMHQHANKYFIYVLNSNITNRMYLHTAMYMGTPIIQLQGRMSCNKKKNPTIRTYKLHYNEDETASRNLTILLCILQNCQYARVAEITFWLLRFIYLL